MESKANTIRYLWPGYTDHASDQHVLLLALMITTKHRENLPAWSHLEASPSNFSSFFRRALSMSVNTSLSPKLRTQLLCFVIAAFQSLDQPQVRKECVPLVSISIWHNLHNDAAREEMFNSHLRLRKVWRAATKRYEQSDEGSKARLRFDRAWLYTLVLDLINKCYSEPTGDAAKETILYCQRFLELLTDLQSQLPTRRYVNTLLRDLNFFTAIQLSPLYETDMDGLFRDLFKLLLHFTTFPTDDFEEKQLSVEESFEAHCRKLGKLQRIGFTTLEEKLKILALSNFGSLSKPEDLKSHFSSLTLEEITGLCEKLGIRTKYPGSVSIVLDKSFFIQVLVYTFERKAPFQDEVRDLDVVPTERILYDRTFLKTEDYDGSTPLAIPKLNLQYLTVGDFLWRSFILHRCESFYAIRQDVESAIRKMKPRLTATGTTRFESMPRMALPLDQNVAVIDVGRPNVGEVVPSEVRVEVILDVRRLPFHIRREWETLKPHDVVFLLAVEPAEQKKSTFGNGVVDHGITERKGLRYLRAAQVSQVQDEKGRVLREPRDGQEIDDAARPRQRRLILALDTRAYQDDMDKKAKSRGPDVYQSLNVILRRHGRENNFKAVLESIKRLTLSDVPTPAWLRDVFLGYGNPTDASYRRLSNRLGSIDFRDTFLDWQHLVESFSGKSLEPSEDMNGSFPPPYVLDFVEDDVEGGEDDRPVKKRRREQIEAANADTESIRVSTYKPPNTGPYPMDAPRVNSVRFTPRQVEAITSGTQPGLTIIVGPPGTGKTDVATQIISNIYHNFPSQRTLLVAHSNQALNQLFQKIVALDVDERHLLRLGHGEEELETEASYSKHGRVESFLERGAYYLAEVTRLATSLNAPGAHGNSCETADYFDQVYIKPAWIKYWDAVHGEDVSAKEIVDNFPFHDYFSNAPQPLFPKDAPKEKVLDIVTGCYRHVEKIFTELADIRPFEILRSSRDKANYLLVKEARIIAMTSTHAAMRRQEIASLGFRYDNVVLEEAAQITEIETFIPLALQKPQDGNLPLQRVVLVGDHLQNAPVIQNLAFRQYANLAQSLFLRLVRLGAPTIELDMQGRARPSIASLYHWRYPHLGDLPAVTAPAPSEYAYANAGFKFDYQFIEVPDYRDKGEMEPTPHFIQNLGEAEYAVALYMYMRLLGYPASKISILTMYAGQRALIKDVLGHRCRSNPLFGLPRVVSTVDRFQGEQNDCKFHDFHQETH
jgi:intron-binding protein aquarius